MACLGMSKVALFRGGGRKKRSTAGDEGDDGFNVSGCVVVQAIGSLASLNEIEDLLRESALEARLSSGGDLIEVGVGMTRAMGVFQH